MKQFLSENYDWLFSGIAVSILGIFLGSILLSTRSALRFYQFPKLRTKFAKSSIHLPFESLFPEKKDRISVFYDGVKMEGLTTVIFRVRNIGGKSVRWPTIHITTPPDQEVIEEAIEKSLNAVHVDRSFLKGERVDEIIYKIERLEPGDYVTVTSLIDSPDHTKIQGHFRNHEGAILNPFGSTVKYYPTSIEKRPSPHMSFLQAQC